MTERQVLVVEDSRTQAAELRAYLEEAGFDVLVAGDGAQALDVLAQQPVDIIVSDVVMPDVDGYELCARAKEGHPSVPVVLLTSMTDPLDVVRALSAGADNFLRKPYEPADLIHRVRNMLHNKDLRDSGRAQMGLELFFLGRRFMINADREQILDLLVSTFEELVAVNRRLSVREEELAAARDELARRLAETARERDRLQAVIDAMPGCMAVFDRDGRVLHANAHLADLVGVPLHHLNGSVVWDLVRFVDHQNVPLQQDARPLCQTLSNGQGVVSGTAFELFLQKTAGERVPVIARSEPLLSGNGSVIGAVGTLEDLAAVKDHDPVTGLPGHAVLLDRLQRAASRGAADHGAVATIAVVVDRFQRFRDSLTSEQLDGVLAGVSARLREMLHVPDVATRAPRASATYLGNFEFAVVLPQIEDEEDVILVAQQLVDGMASTVESDGLALPVTVSAGVAICSEAENVAAVVSSAAIEARTASRAGGSRIGTTDPSRHAEVVDQLRREAELRDAIDHGQLVVHYQPQLSVHNEQPMAVEALVRWEHPERGLLGSGEVVPLAIDCGLISSVSWAVLESACRQVVAWHERWDEGVAPHLSVNLAAEQLADVDVVERISAVLERTGLDPQLLMLEITEGTVMDDPPAARERLSRLKALGCRIAVDDFGTGYSSLLHLRRLPVDILKIDRTFIGGMLEQPADAAIVTAVIRMARALGLEVVAEGVETADQLVQLRLLGCDLGQGFHWTPALPAEDMQRWWQEHAAEAFHGDTGQARGAVEIDERQDEVLSYLVHELRSPLAVVKGYAELLRDTVPDAPGDLIEPIVRNAMTLEQRLGSLREVYDLLRGGLTLRTADHDVAELVGTLVDDMEAELKPHPVSFSGGGVALAPVDRVRLLQAVGNLLVNAAKFSPPDAPIEVSVQAVDAVVAIEVRDHGPGVPEERRPELFRRFSRLGSTATGMGLGLYLARLVADAHGGVVAHRDAADGGAVFTIRLPRRSTTRDFGPASS